MRSAARFLTSGMRRMSSTRTNVDAASPVAFTPSDFVENETATWDVLQAETIRITALRRFGDVERSVMTLSARAVCFDAKILGPDESTYSLDPEEAPVVLEYIDQAKEHGGGIVLVTHTAHHAFLINGDRRPASRSGASR